MAKGKVGRHTKYSKALLKKAGKFATPELNLIAELRRLSELDRDDVVQLVIANTEV